MRARAASILLALLLTVPVATAFSLPWSGGIAVPPQHAGDSYAYARHLDGSGDHAQGDSQLVVQVVGPAPAVDRFGVTREATTFREQLTQGGQVVTDDDCHLLWNSAQAVRRDVLASPPGYQWSSSELVRGVSGSTTIQYTPRVSFGMRSCDGYDVFAGASYHVGDRIHLWAPTIVPGLPDFLLWTPSQAGVATTFHGRDAIAFTFDAASLAPGSRGTFTITLADGIPVIARVASDVDQPATAWSAARHVRASAELVGFEGGNGAPVPQGNDQMPSTNPAASFRPTDPRAVDDAGYRLTFPFADARDAAMSDPGSPLPAYLRAHKDAILVGALYERHPQTGTAVGETDGSWLLVYADASSQQAVTVQRQSGLGLIAAPQKVTTTTTSSVDKMWPAPAAPPGQEASSADLARLVEQGGLPLSEVESFDYFVGRIGSYTYAVAYVSDQPYTYARSGTESGTILTLVTDEGALNAVDQKERIDAGPILGAPSQVTEAKAGDVLSGPSTGLGIAGAAAGVALLLLVVKLLLLPLFTRLRRAALLDNPVRARLYERVRAEPGIHQAELVDYAGVGRGATVRHLEQLVKHGYLAALDVEGFARYYAAGEVPPDVARREAALRAGSARAVYELYARAPATPLRAAAAELRLSAPTVHRAKKRLEKAGLLPAGHGAESPAVLVR